MTPQHVEAATTLAGIIGQMGGPWPFLLAFLLLVLAPVLVVVWANRGWREIVQANTAAVTRLTDAINGNLYCPLVRLKEKTVIASRRER